MRVKRIVYRLSGGTSLFCKWSLAHCRLAWADPLREKNRGREGGVGGARTKTKKNVSGKKEKRQGDVSAVL